MSTDFQSSERPGDAVRPAWSSLSAAAANPIPISDPDAALVFCRRLSALLDDARPETLARVHAGSGVQVPRRQDPDVVLSVVIPLYDEEDSIPSLYRRLGEVLATLGATHEIIFVNDGSHDATARLLLALAATDPCITVINLARNFGHQAAISAGLDYAGGDAVIVMDGDLQDPPEFLPKLVERWREGYEVVYAVRDSRSEGAFWSLVYRSFYRLLHRVANVDIPVDAGDFCLMDRRVVSVIRSLPERNRFLRGLRSWAGFRQVGIPYDRPPRRAGRSKYSLGRLLLLALDGLVSFSYVPLRISSFCGALIAAGSFGLGVFYAIKRLTTGLNPAGFATIMVALLFLTGIQLLTIGVMGEYVGRIFEEVKRRPAYVVRDVIARGVRCAS
ncbi:MAG: glycosyltransferase family 2 protein [Anaerolineae bacterium]